MNTEAVPVTIPEVNTPTITPKQLEVQEFKEVVKAYKDTPKFKRWCELYFDKENTETYGNKTKSALIAYNLDPKKKYFIAGNIGSQNYKKLQNMGHLVGAAVLEQEGYAFPVLLKAMLSKALQGGMGDMVTLMEFIGYTPESPKSSTNVQQNVQVNIGQDILRVERERGLAPSR